MNVQQLIIKGIKDRLFYHDYLVLPDFGGFVLKATPTHFSGSSLIQPPSKTVRFNIQLRQNDGILAAWLQEKLLCTASESLTHLKEFSEYCQSVLNTKRRLTLDSIGFFYLDFENNLCFEPQQDTNFLTGSFGLAPVSAKEIEFETTEIKKEPVFTDRRLITPQRVEQKQRTKFNYKRLIAPSAFLILLFGLLLMFVSNSRISGQLRASVLGIYEGSNYQPVSYPDLDLMYPTERNQAYVADANGIATLEINEKKSIAVRAVEEITTLNFVKHPAAIKVRNGINKNYEIVLGCFGILDNAKRMAAKLSQQNIDVVISERNTKGLYTVSNGNFESKSEALGKLEKLKAAVPGAWIKNP